MQVIKYHALFGFGFYLTDEECKYALPAMVDGI